MCRHLPRATAKGLAFLFVTSAAQNAVWGFVVHNPSISARRSSLLSLPSSTQDVGNMASTEEAVATKGMPDVVDDMKTPAVSPTVASDVPSLASPGALENDKFSCDDSVFFWQSFVSGGSQENLNRAREIVSSYMAPSNDKNAAKRLAYWTSHILRTSYFMGNAVLGTLGHEVHDSIVASRRNNNKATDSPNLGRSMLQSGVASRLLFEVAKAYEQDWKRVEKGDINFPWDAAINGQNNNPVRLQLDHRQLNPLFVLSESGRVIRESISIFSRRASGKSSGVWTESSPTMEIYPDYYLNDFHYQTDGWMSSSSAAVYEASTETLFLGRQDSMQRQTIVPLARHFGTTKSPGKILEVACGTGRFSTFVRDNFPAAEVTLSDLSPFYLEKARKNDEYWQKYRGEAALAEQGMAGSKPDAAKLLQANAESLPLEDNSFDAVTCVYLFHELPEEARANAAKEMARVLKPGGVLVLTDSIQLGDRPPLDKSIGNFSRLNEPHYQDYIATDLPALFEKHGLLCGEKYVSSTTKSLSFTKPPLSA